MVCCIVVVYFSCCIFVLYTLLYSHVVILCSIFCLFILVLYFSVLYALVLYYLYLHAFRFLNSSTTLGLNSNVFFFEVLKFCFQLVYQNFYLLDDCSGLFNWPQQFQSKLNVDLIIKLYLLAAL